MDEADLQRDSLSADDLIDLVCDGFEAELKAGRRPDLDRTLELVPNELRSSLLHELVLVGLEYAGDSVSRPRSSDTTKPGQRQARSDGNEPSTTPDTNQLRTSNNDDVLALQLGIPSLPAVIGGYELLSELGRG